VVNKCPDCGLENRPNANFCDGCGHSFGDVQESDSASFALPEGSVLKDRFIIKELIKVGGMGAVYKAEDKVSGKICAVKELWTFWATSQEEKNYLIAKFESEGNILSKLISASLPAMIDYFINNDRYYLVMEFIEGQDLDHIVETCGNPGLPWEQVLKWGIQVCEVLEYLHGSDPPIVYRDLKPSNIMIRNADNSIVLIDFGIACTLQEGSSGSPRTMIGTMGYMPPEQFLGKIGITSDIFSLGATLYYLLTGELQSLFAYKPMSSIVPDISEKLEDVIRRALEFKPEDRFQCATELKMDLERVLKPDFLTTRRLSEVDLWIGQLNTAKDNKSKLEAIIMLESFPGYKVTRALMNALTDEPSPVVRKSAAITLGKLKDLMGIPILLEKTKDPSVEVGVACIHSLCKFDDVRVFPCLTSCLRDRDGEIRKNAAMALEELGDVRAIDALLDARSKEGLFNIGLKRVMSKAIDTLKAMEKDKQAFLLQEEEKLTLSKDGSSSELMDEKLKVNGNFENPSVKANR